MFNPKTSGFAAGNVLMSRLDSLSDFHPHECVFKYSFSSTLPETLQLFDSRFYINTIT